ncbi:MAG TPA: SH3 domain-containing protein [Anaerolineales bacterium]|nr:SH3 domain-containing protein [Anaerolineales bacterium]
MPYKPNRLIFIFISLLIAGCSVQVKNESTPTASPFIVTATLPATPKLQPTETPQPLPLQPTVAPLAGVTSTQLNVRAGPSTASEVIGIIPTNSTLQITGKDIGGNWWQINYEAGAEGKGWVTAQYVETGDSSGIPVIGGDGTDPSAGNTALVVQQINIRSGPGTSFDSIGILNANDVVTLTGKNSTGTWLQIDYPPGPDGRGWVNSGFVKADDVTDPPIVSEGGSVIGTGTAVNTPIPPPPTLVPAAMDFDSADAPIKTIILGQAANTILYSGDVSSPGGDTEDWISVTTGQNMIYARIECLGSDLVDVEIVGKGLKLICNQTLMAIAVMPNTAFLIHIEAVGTSQLQYTKYLLELRSSR